MSITRVHLVANCAQLVMRLVIRTQTALILMNARLVHIPVKMEFASILRAVLHVTVIMVIKLASTVKSSITNVTAFIQPVST